MGIIGKTLDFLFGKNPDIFDEKGRVRHKLPKEKWEAWDNRYRLGTEYNWRQHSGTQAKGLSQKK